MDCMIESSLLSESLIQDEILRKREYLEGDVAY